MHWAKSSTCVILALPRAKAQHPKSSAIHTVAGRLSHLKTRHVKAALSVMPVKPDRNDAQGLAQLMRPGWFRPVHCKSIAAQEVRALLTARELVHSKLYDIAMS